MSNLFSRSVVLCAVALVGAGCGGAPPALSEVFPEAPGVNCQNGGIAVARGADGNGDGSLSGEEIESTNYICNAGTLVSSTVVAPGADCSAGGFRVATGVDLDDNGTLEPAEERSFDFVCNEGEALISMANEPAGDNCLRGGSAVHSGNDANANGTLDAAEILATEYLCNRYVVETAAGSWHTCNLISDGTVSCVGMNMAGQTGGVTSDVFPQTDFATVPGLSGVTQVTAGSAHTCALLEDKTVRCWGTNIFGNLGLGDEAIEGGNTPVTPMGLTDVEQIDAGSIHTCAVLTGGDVKCWGNNADGESGGTEIKVVAAPTAVAGLSGPAKQVSAGGHHSCAVMVDTTIQCWGMLNAVAELAQFVLGNATIAGGSETPVSVLDETEMPMNGFAQVSAGVGHSCATTLGARAYCWGDHTLDRLGNGGATAATSVPTGVVMWDDLAELEVSLLGVKQVSAGRFHTCAAMNDGTARCWGQNDVSQLGASFDSASESMAVLTDAPGGVANVSLPQYNLVLGEFPVPPELPFSTAVIHGVGYGWGQLRAGGIAYFQMGVAPVDNGPMNFYAPSPTQMSSGGGLY